MQAHNPVRVQVVAGGVQQAGGIGLADAAGEAFADQPALAVAAVGVEAVADDRPAVAHRVGHHRHQAGGHLGEVDVGVADRRPDRPGHLADIDDADGHAKSPAGGGWLFVL
jgi:hypothetical protein